MKQNFFLVMIALGAFAVIMLGLIAAFAPGSKTSKKMRGGMIAVMTLGLAAVVAIAGILIWFMPIRNESKNYNLFEIQVDESALPTMQDAVDEGFVQLSEVNMHYVKYGTGGHDVVLIHGNGGSTDSLKDLARYLANDYTVYCLDSRCQGKSSDPGYITYELMAMDVNEFIEAKGLYKPYVFGHSDGGMVGIALAANYPDSLGALVSCGSNSNPDTFKFYFTWGVAWNNMMHEHTKLNDLMLTEPDFTPEYLSRITVPTYVVAGECDIMPLSDSVYIHNNIKGSEIAIMKWGDHGSYFGEHCENVYVLAKDFFERHEI